MSLSVQVYCSGLVSTHTRISYIDCLINHIQNQLLLYLQKYGDDDISLLLIECVCVKLSPNSVFDSSRFVTWYIAISDTVYLDLCNILISYFCCCVSVSLIIFPLFPFAHVLYIHIFVSASL